MTTTLYKRFFEFVEKAGIGKSDGVGDQEEIAELVKDHYFTNDGNVDCVEIKTENPEELLRIVEESNLDEYLNLVFDYDEDEKVIRVYDLYDYEHPFG